MSCVGTTITGRSSCSQTDLATSIVLPPPTATTASACGELGGARERFHLCAAVVVYQQRLARRGAELSGDAGGELAGRGRAR